MISNINLEASVSSSGFGASHVAAGVAGGTTVALAGASELSDGETLN